MSSLKEEWVSLMKLRGLGQVDKSQNQEIKSRIFNNFYSVRQENLDKKPYQADISVKQDYESLRSDFLKSIAVDNRSRTPNLPAKFEFGLKNIELPPSQHKLNRTDIKSEEIWSMNDSPYLKQPLEIIPDRFEQSFSSSQMPISSKSLPTRSIKIFSDLSPVTRYLCSLDEKEESRFLSETQSHDSHIFSMFHVVHEELSVDDLSVVTWKEASDLTRGLIFRAQVISALNPPTLMREETLNDKSKISVSHCYSEQPVQLETSISRKDAFKTSNSTSPLLGTAGGIESLEKELMDMMDQINQNYRSATIEQKIKALLKKTQEKLGQNTEIVGNSQIAAIYQFLQEYLKLQEKKSQPAQVKRPVQNKPVQRKAVTPVKSSKLNTIPSNSSLASSKTSKWIGGSKYQDEFDDEDWVSVNQEKKKKESRNEMLYKLSMKHK